MEQYFENIVEKVGKSNFRSFVQFKEMFPEMYGNVLRFMEIFQKYSGNILVLKFPAILWKRSSFSSAEPGEKVVKVFVIVDVFVLLLL